MIDQDTDQLQQNEQHEINETISSEAKSRAMEELITQNCLLIASRYKSETDINKKLDYTTALVLLAVSAVINADKFNVDIMRLFTAARNIYSKANTPTVSIEKKK